MTRPAVLVTVVLTVGCSASVPTDRIDSEIVGLDQIEEFASAPTFARVRDLARDAEGLWVLDARPPFVTRVSAAGVTTSRFGSEGRGPAELRRPVAIVGSPGGVLVLDPDNEKVVAFGPGGVLDRLAHFPRERSGRIRPDILDVTYVDPWRFRSIGSAFAFARFERGVSHAIDTGFGEIVVVEVPGGPTRPVTDLSDYVPLDRSSTGQFASMPLWDACDGQFVLWDPRTSTVRWSDPNGRLLHEVSVRLSAPEVQLRDVESFFRHMARLELGPGYEASGIDFEDYARRNRAAIGTATAVFADLRCEPGGAAWLERFDLSDDPLGRGHTWIRVRQEGISRAVTFPDGFRPFRFTEEGVAYGVLSDIDGDRLSLWRFTE